MPDGGAASSWFSLSRVAQAATGFASRQYNRRKSLFFSKPEYEHELPASNLSDTDEAAAIERERLRREESGESKQVTKRPSLKS